MARAEKTRRVRNLRYGPRTRLVRGIYFIVASENLKLHQYDIVELTIFLILLARVRLCKEK